MTEHTREYQRQTDAATMAAPTPRGAGGNAAAAVAPKPALDQAKIDAFGERFLNGVNEASLMLMMSIGHRTGLYDTMARLTPATSTRIAEAANLNERYVREWLGAMVTGGIVDYDADTGLYHLPAEHAACLTRDAEANLAATAQWFAVLGSVETGIVDRFRHGGGLHYECFHRFHETMAEESAQTVVVALDSFVIDLAPGLRQRLVRGIDVLDIGCGSGLALCKLAELFPNSRFTGYDLCTDAIANARREMKRRGLMNVSFEPRDITNLNQPQRYDLVTAFDVIHDQKAPATVLREVHKALKPDGVFLMQDIRASSYLEKNIGRPLAPFFYTISTMHCMTVSLAQGGDGLGTCWGEELAVKMLGEAGFHDIEVHQPPHDIQNNFYVSRPRAN